MNDKHPLELLMNKSSEWNYSLLDEEFAKKLDSEDEMSRFRDMFYYPKMKGLYSGISALRQTTRCHKKE